MQVFLSSPPALHQFTVGKWIPSPGLLEAVLVLLCYFWSQSHLSYPVLGAAGAGEPADSCPNSLQSQPLFAPNQCWAFAFLWKQRLLLNVLFFFSDYRIGPEIIHGCQGMSPSLSDLLQLQVLVLLLCGLKFTAGCLLAHSMLRCIGLPIAATERAAEVEVVVDADLHNLLWAGIFNILASFLSLNW